MLKTDKIEAAVVHTYDNGRYSKTLSDVFTPKNAERFCSCFNRMGNQLHAVVELVPISTNPASHINGEA